MIQIKQIDIEKIGPINSVHINFNPHFNIICGKNGIGKTTILECIAQSFIQANNQDLKRNAKQEKGSWKISIVENDNPLEKDFETTILLPSDRNNSRKHGFTHLAKEIIVFKTNRIINYSNVANVTKDAKRDKGSDMGVVKSGVTVT